MNRPCILIGLISLGLTFAKLNLIIFTVERPINVKSRPRLPIPDEDPYYIPGTVMTRITDSSDSGYGGISGNSNRSIVNAADSPGITIVITLLCSLVIMFCLF